MSRRPGYRHPFAAIGGPAEVRWEVPDMGHYIDPTATIHEFCSIHNGTFRRTWIGPDVWLMAGVHVAHDCVIHEGVEIAPGTKLGGEVEIGHHAKLGIGVKVRPKIRIGQRAVIGAGAVVVKDVPAGETWVGNPARRISSSKELEHTTASTESLPASSTRPATNIASSGPTASSPATAADEAFAARSASPAGSTKPTTTPQRRLGGRIAQSGPHAAEIVPSLTTDWPSPTFCARYGHRFLNGDTCHDCGLEKPSA